jgi:dihydroorotase
MKTLIYNVTIVNENRIIAGDVLIENNFIAAIDTPNSIPHEMAEQLIDGTGLHLLPGLIDDQVHFREPGLTHKGDIFSESKAAVAGGITSFMEMPNTNPPALTVELLEDKYKIGAEKSLANYSFFMGTSNTNLDEILKIDYTQVCGLKIFMGSSTGNLAVDDKVALERVFEKVKTLIAVHCEDDPMVKVNLEKYKEQYGEDIPTACHALIRDEEVCYKSSSYAVALAQKYNTRLHILHISTAKELSLFRNDIPLSEKRITAEACIHHLWFCDEDYGTLGNKIKWNPAVKKASDRAAIRQAIIDDRIDVIATDHAPHTMEEKSNRYSGAPSGGPLVQHALVALLEMHHNGIFSLEKIVQKTAHNVADMFSINKRGYIRKNYFADLVLVSLNDPWTVERENILYHCGWSPFEGNTFTSKIISTWVNGKRVYNNGEVDASKRGMRITFNR